MSYFERTNYQGKKQDAGLAIFTPVNSQNKIESIEKSQFGSIVFVIEISGVKFSRISSPNLKDCVIWTDINSVFGQRDLMSKEKESELESIFVPLLNDYLLSKVK